MSRTRGVIGWDETFTLKTFKSARRKPVHTAYEPTLNRMSTYFTTNIGTTFE